MTCMSKDAKFHKDVESEKDTIISGLWSLLEQIQWLLPITKNGTDETTPEYDILYIVKTSFL